MYQRFKTGITGFGQQDRAKAGVQVRGACGALGEVGKRVGETRAGAISSRISGKSTRGSLAATASRKAKSDGGSTVSNRTAGLLGKRAATVR